MLVVSANIVFALGACTSYETAYEKHVYDYEPIYCYQTIGVVDCRREPNRRDAARLVNYYGPAPNRYALSPQPKDSVLQPPPEAKADHSPASPSMMPVDEGTSKTGAAGGEVDRNAKPEWKEWLPLVSVAFGALQAAAAFLF